MVHQEKNNGFTLNSKIFLGVLLGVHLALRIIDWPSYSSFFLTSLGFGAYYLIKASIFLLQKQYRSIRFAVLVSLLFLLIANKFIYQYFNLLLNLLILFLIGFILSKLLKAGDYGNLFRSRLYELLTIAAMIQLIPDRILFDYATKTFNLRTWDIPVTYADFKKDHPQDHKYDATLYSQFYIVISKVYHYPPILSVSYMEPDSSGWRDLPQASAESDAELLMHEQLHFDITELWRRRMEDSLARSFFKSYTETRSVIDYFYLKRNRMQYEYDSLTSHGTIAKEQFKWDQNIRYQLSK